MHSLLFFFSIKKKSRGGIARREELGVVTSELIGMRYMLFIFLINVFV